jgi:hypothetical protein
VQSRTDQSDLFNTAVFSKKFLFNFYHRNIHALFKPFSLQNAYGYYGKRCKEKQAAIA